MKLMIGIAAVLAALLCVQPAVAAPGDTLYVQKNGVNVRLGPGTNHGVFATLNKGHELIEFGRDGEWVHVGIAQTDGKDGWIHGSLVGETPSAGDTVVAADPPFDAFVKDVEQLNGLARAIAGFQFFPRIENLGDGIVQLTADDRWIAASRADRQSNVDTLADLWAEREGSGLPVAVYIVDSRGSVVMKEMRP